MEDIHNTTSQEDSEDTLSLRNLPITDYSNTNSFHTTPRSSSAQEPFDFFTHLPSQSSPYSNNILFCGQIIPYDNDDELNEYQKRDYLTLIKSASFRKPHHIYQEEDKGNRAVTKTRSNSGRFSGSDTQPYKCSSSVQKVNFTTLTNMSAKSRRRMSIFGPVKFKPEMELSAIRDRQSRRAPAPMFPALEGGEMVAGEGGRGKSQGGMVRSLRCRTHLSTVLARSFGCIPLT